MMIIIIILCCVNFRWAIVAYVTAAVGGSLAVAAAPVFVRRIGFSTTGIKAGSAAAWMMRMSRIGGQKRIPIAAMQAIGTSGTMGLKATTVTAIAGATVTKALYSAIQAWVNSVA